MDIKITLKAVAVDSLFLKSILIWAKFSPSMKIEDLSH